MQEQLFGLIIIIIFFKYLTVKIQLISKAGLLVLILITPGCTNLIESSVASSIEPESGRVVFDRLDFSEPIIRITDNNKIIIIEPDQVIDCRGAVLDGGRELAS